MLGGKSSEPDFRLGPQEFVVTKTDHARHGRATMASLVLTTDRIIVIATKGVFGTKKEVTSFPLTSIRNAGADPRGMVSGSTLEVFFADSHEEFGFSKKREARAWAENICRLIAGESEEFVQTDDSAVGAATDAVKETIDSFKKSFGLAAASRKPARRADVECHGCGALVSGVVGRSVECSHCGATVQVS